MQNVKKIAHENIKISMCIPALKMRMVIVEHDDRNTIDVLE